jgi:hypothetical protein
LLRPSHAGRVRQAPTDGGQFLSKPLVQPAGQFDSLGIGGTLCGPVKLLQLIHREFALAGGAGVAPYDERDQPHQSRAKDAVHGTRPTLSGRRRKPRTENHRQQQAERGVKSGLYTGYPRARDHRQNIEKAVGDVVRRLEIDQKGNAGDSDWKHRLRRQESKIPS